MKNLVAPAFLIAASLIALNGCAKPARISATLDITRKSSDTVWLMLRMKNLDDRVTTPLAPVVIVQTRTGAAWDKPVSQVHPVAFVLNKQEQRDIFKVLHTGADVVRATLTVKEQENGRVIVNQRFEKSIPTSALTNSTTGESPK